VAALGGSNNTKIERGKRKIQFRCKKIGNGGKREIGVEIKSNKM
jgi:hypothetical protein